MKRTGYIKTVAVVCWALLAGMQATGGSCDWTNCVIPNIEFKSAPLSNVVAELNRILSVVGPTGETVRIEIAHSTNDLVDGCTSNVVQIEQTTVTLQASAEFYSDSFYANTSEFTLEKRDGKWVVIKVEVMGFS